MFRSVKPDTGTEAATAPPSRDDSSHLEPVPLVVLELSLTAPVEWAAFLADRGMSIIIDDIGRPAVSRSDARLLLTEQREAEARRRERAAELERQAVEQDRLRRANLPTGIPAGMVPDGLAPAEAMMLAGESSGPRARSVREQLLERELGSGESMVFHSFRPDGEA
jgi:hypothetical protein